jgi:DNA-binding protein YbaB
VVAEQPERAERPNWSALGNLIGDLKKSLDTIGESQKQVAKLTGTAWSDDKLVKAVVGPRGHLIELDLDPRVYRTPNSKALSATIVSTVKAAIDDVMAKSQEILEESLPSDLRAGVQDTNLAKWMRQHDADAIADGDEDDG